MNQKADPAAYDDVLMQQTMYVVKNRPVKLVIGSRDVIHDVGLPHFRMKMDAVPGIPTTLWFTPKFTTKEMQNQTSNPNFEYEIACDQICGNGHYSMKGIIKVVTQDEYDVWMATQKPSYFAAFPEKDPSAKPASPTVPAPGADSAKPATAKVAVGGTNDKKTKVF
jgi:cytochrome c oxidase subunit 2